MAKRIQTVASPGWSVSTTTSDRTIGAVLNVSRASDMRRRGDGDGRLFPTSDAAFTWALEHGYTQVHVTPWCLKCRVRHTFIKGRSGFCDVHSEFVYRQKAVR